MSSQIEHQTHSQPNKVKLMAIRYQKYLQKEKENHKGSAKFSCALKMLSSLYSSMTKVWKHTGKNTNI